MQASQENAAASPDAVAVQDLVVRRGRAVALDRLNCTVPAGRITGLLGPSGSGKTTLMRAVVGVQKLTSGSVTVLGLPAGHPRLRGTVGYMTQAPSVYRDISVRENVAYFASLLSRNDDDVRAALAAVGLTGLAGRKTGDLSGGQFSRVSLACALVGGPAILVLDEPTVGLDPVLRVELWDEFAQLARSGVTLLISSHVMEEAAHCDSLLLLRNGALVGALTPAELRSRAATEDLELAFLRLIREQEAGEVSA